MNKNEINSMGGQLPSGWTVSDDDSLDLRELCMALWQRKWLIVATTSLFAVVGIVYALLAPQVWSTKAVIDLPQSKELASLNRLKLQADLVGLSGIPSEQEVFNDFVQRFNAYDRRRDFLQASDLFAQEVKEQAMDTKGQRRWVRKWAELIQAEPVDKKKELPGIALSLSADTAETSLQMTQGYISYVIEQQRESLIEELKASQEHMLESLETQLKMVKEDAVLALKRDIANTELSAEVARAAGVSTPLENYADKDRFAIMLGTKGLDARLKVLKSIDLTVYQPKLVELQSKIDRLKALKLDDLHFQPFIYLDAPEEPLTRDKPKRPLVVVLATLLGGMLGIGIALILHAFRRPKMA
ncbi:LPS O-antigen chain length determinant protein WzzB [Aeromonas simiae]|uniref:LPS O-antigen chain length determinant protein WzzB n=1 Tax=Aeromonas simiae TaxID=218936 RepID=UPI0038D0E7D8